MSFQCDVQPEFYDHSEPVARKEHECCECRMPIRKGEKHFVAVGKWEGQLDSYRQHTLCCQACMYIRDNITDGECIGFGELFEYYGEWKRGWQGVSQYRKHPPFRAMMAKIIRRKRYEQLRHCPFHKWRAGG